MAFVDWSDPEDMFDLLLEYLADERGAAGDWTRRRILSTLTTRLEELQERFADLSAADAIESLRAIQGSVVEDIAEDPVFEHLAACIQELERVRR